MVNELIIVNFLLIKQSLFDLQALLSRVPTAIPLPCFLQSLSVSLTQ